MLSVRFTAIDGLEDILSPRFRIINFGQGPHQKTVVTCLRNAWTAIPPEGLESADDAIEAVKHWMRNRGPDTEYGAAVPQNADKDTVDTPWRQELLRLYNHLYYDIGNFLPEVNCALGHHHPPSHSSFALSYPLDTSTQDVIKTFDTNVTILPAFLDRDVEVKITLLPRPEDEKEHELGVFNSDNMEEAFFIAAGLKVKFTVTVREKSDVDAETEEQKPEAVKLVGDRREGVAVVFAVGLLCTKSHSAVQEDDEDEDDDEDEEDEDEDEDQGKD